MKHYFSIILLFLFTISGYSQTDEYFKIYELFRNWNSTETPGCAVGIIRDKTIVYGKCYGMGNLADKTAITLDSKFAIASLSKQFTAYCMAILIHQNQVTLYDDIREYLPEFPKSDTVFYDIYDFGYEYKFRTNDNSDIIGLWTYHTNYMKKVDADTTTDISNDYVGAFYCKELNTMYSLFKKEDRMYCKINSNTSEELIASGIDSFRYKRNVLRLIRNDPDDVNGLQINNRYNFDKIE